MGAAEVCQAEELKHSEGNHGCRGIGGTWGSLHSSTYSYWTGLGLGQISCWLITIQILYPSPNGVLVNSYWNDPKSQGIVDS